MAGIIITVIVAATFVILALIASGHFGGPLAQLYKQKLEERALESRQKEVKLLERETAVRERLNKASLDEATKDESAEALKAKLRAESAEHNQAAEVIRALLPDRTSEARRLLFDRSAIERALLPETVRADLAAKRDQAAEASSSRGLDRYKYLVQAYQTYCEAMRKLGIEPDNWDVWLNEAGCDPDNDGDDDDPDDGDDDTEAPNAPLVIEAATTDEPPGSTGPAAPAGQSTSTANAPADTPVTN